MKLNSKQLAEITGGKAIGNFSVNSYAIDSTKVNQGDLFIALQGEKHDAHKFLQDAIANKAGALLINKSYYEKNKVDFPNLIIVENTNESLLTIAKYVRQQNKGIIIGITGSVGKTTLKDMLAFLLQSCGKVAATLGNYNNQIGLPFSLVFMEPNDDFGVFEMGMSSAGEIALLSKVLQPNIGVITDIAYAHSEFFSSLDDIATAKLEIISAMPKNGTLCINLDNKYYKEHYALATKQLQSVYAFSNHNKLANIYIKSMKVQSVNKSYVLQITASIFKEEVVYTLPSIALHHGFLATIALGIAYLLKQDIQKLAPNFKDFQLPKGRGNLSQEVINGKNITLINDSYNASPKSMLASLESLKAIAKSNKILVLGDMLELGAEEVQAHENLQHIIKKIKPKAVILLGIQMLNLYNILPTNMVKYHFLHWQEATLKLQSLVENSDVVLIKGSLGANAYKIAEDITTNKINR